MQYENITRGIFLDRPNRFVAHVDMDGRIETVHVKNTGRCRELLLPGAEVYLTEPGTPGRKTRYDLVVVRKGCGRNLADSSEAPQSRGGFPRSEIEGRNGILFNIDSQAPNKVVKEWLAEQDFDRVVPEYTYGNSRIDFYMERGAQKYLMEVKGCTLEVDGIGYFPDAPTERGVKHLHGLIRAVKEGYRAIAAFVIQMDGVTEVRPNTATHPEFAAAFAKAVAAGVQILTLPCHVEPDRLTINPGYSLSAAQKKRKVSEGSQEAVVLARADIGR